VAGITGKVRENTGKCPLKNKWQCPTTAGEGIIDFVRPCGFAIGCTHVYYPIAKSSAFRVTNTFSRALG